MINSLKEHLLLNPITLVDVGFKGGMQEKWLALKEHLYVIGFEPNKKEYGQLPTDDSQGRIYYTALWNEKRSIDFFVTKADRLCSCLAPNRKVLDEFPETERFDVLRKIVLPANTLDNVLINSTDEGVGITNPDFIKLDTQGTELNILKGMNDTLNRSVFGVEIEVEFIEMYLGQPLFYKVDEFMQSKGFQLFDMNKLYWRRKTGLGFDENMRGQIIHADALYFRKPDIYMDILKSSGVELKARLLKAVAIALFFGYSDYAICLIDKGENANIINAEDQFTIADLILEDTIKRSNDSNEKGTLPDFTGKSLLIRIIKKLNRLFGLSFEPRNLHEKNYLNEINRIHAHKKRIYGWAQTDKRAVGNNISHR